MSLGSQEAYLFASSRPNAARALVYSLKTQNFDDENYYLEDVTSVVKTYQKNILHIIDKLIDTSFAVLKEYEGHYSK